METFKRMFQDNPSLFSEMVRARMAQTQSAEADDQDPRLRSAREHFRRTARYGKQRAVPMLMWLICIAFDLLAKNKTAQAEGVLALAIAAGDQAQQDSHKWFLAYLLTLQPEPPWAEVSRTPAAPENEFSMLVDPALVAACVARIKDVAALNEARSKKGKGKGKKGKDAETEE